MLSDLEIEFLTLESTEYLCCACFLVYLKPQGSDSAACNLGNLLELLALLACFLERDNIAGLNSVRGDVYAWNI